MESMKNVVEKRYLQIRKLFNEQVPSIILNKIKEYALLDVEYMLNAHERTNGDTAVSSASRIFNKEWRGCWMRATGIDVFLYISYLLLSMENEEDDKETILTEYIRYHPKEKFVPGAIVEALNDAMLVKNLFQNQKE